MKKISHFDESGRAAMVDVAAKAVTRRTAVARSTVVLPPEVMKHFDDGDLKTAKGSLVQTAVLAGIMAAKKTADLIPLCHPLGLNHCGISINLQGKNKLVIDCTASVQAKTGVEMEALVGASVAALTVYDMCKAFSHDIVIKDTRLLLKTGGSRDFS